MTAPADFRRVILGIRHHAPRQGLRQAIDIAHLLQVELRGLFVKDEDLCGLSALPFVREFRPLEGGWRSLDNAELLAALDISARSAERSFREAAKTLDRPCEFEIVQGRSLAAAIAAISRPSDLLVVYGPADPSEHVSVQFQDILQAAFGSPASVMLVPSKVVRESGTVVALSDTSGDPCIDVAAKIAERAKEPLSVIDCSAVLDELRADAGLRDRDDPSRMDVVRQPLLSVVAGMLNPIRERLLILSRGRLGQSLAGPIAAVRQVPVLVVEPRSDQE